MANCECHNQRAVKNPGYTTVAFQEILEEESWSPGGDWNVAGL